MESAYQLAASTRSTEGAETTLRFDGYIDEVTEDGRVLGWACRPGAVARLQVGIFQGSRLIGRAVTHGYRADLLAAGHGLGYCAFAARLHEPPPPGRCELGLGLPGLPAAIRRYPLSVPAIRRAALPTAAAARWTDEDLRQHVSRLGLSAQLAALGPTRFVDGACQFVLGRWADPAMIEAARRDIAAGTFDADDFLRSLIDSDERQAARAEPLPTPFEPRFAFTYPCPAPAG